MPIDVNSSDWLYQLFRNSGPSADLILPATLLNLFSNTGVLLNASVVYVTLRNRKFRGTAHFLLAQISVYEVLHQLGHLLLLILALTGINFLDMLTAASIMLLPVFATNGTMMAITSAAADRLLAVLGWTIENRMSKCMYLALHSMISLCYGIYGAQNFYRFALEHPNLPKTGYMHDMLIDPSTQDRFTRDSTIQNCIAIGCYVFIWIAVKVKKQATQETNSRLLKSLLVIVLVNIGCYLVNMAIYQIAFTGASYNDLLMWQLSFINGILLNIGAASNAPILYVTSTDYRQAFNEFILPKKLFQSAPPTVAAPMEMTASNNNKNIISKGIRLKQQKTLHHRQSVPAWVN